MVIHATGTKIIKSKLLYLMCAQVYKLNLSMTHSVHRNSVMFIDLVSSLYITV